MLMAHVPADPRPVSRRRLHYALSTPPRPSSPPLHSSEKWLSRARPVTDGRRHEAPARGGLPPARLQAAPPPTPPGRCPRLAPFSLRPSIPTVRPAPLHPLVGSGHSPHLYPRWPSAQPPAAEHTPIRPSISPAENSPPPRPHRQQQTEVPATSGTPGPPAHALPATRTGRGARQAPPPQAPAAALSWAAVL